VTLLLLMMLITMKTALGIKTNATMMINCNDDSDGD
jgi:hypothetical protein